MYKLDRLSIGKALRKKRKSLGWTLDNVADMSNGELSKSTISNIERGFPGVKEEKIEYLSQLLNVNIDQIHLLIQEDDKLNLRWKRKLLRIEQLIDLVGSEKAHKQLKGISLDSGNSLIVLHRYLVARCHYHKRQYLKSNKEFSNCLQLLNKFPEMEYTNIRAACFKELGRISFFYHNNLEQALQFTEQGLDAFLSEGERKVTKYTLLSSKASYLEKMQRNEDALHVLDELRSEQDQWYRNIEVVLNMYEIRANLAAKHHLYEDATRFAKEGLELARSNKHHERALELMTTLGNIRYLKRDFEEAEDWYKLALELESRINREYLFVSTYTQLGTLYMDLEQLDKAKEYLHIAVEKGESNDDGIRYHLALIALGDFYVKLERNREAISYYEKALNQAKKFGFPLIDPDLYIKLSHCYQYIDLHKSNKYVKMYMEVRLNLNKGS